MWTSSLQPASVSGGGAWVLALGHIEHVIVNNILKLAIAPYFVLGMVMGASFSKHSARHPGRDGLLILGAIHVLLIVGAYFLARNSIRNGTRLSPTGLAIGFALAYFAGFFIFLFV
jgi:hypothetical protein